MSQVIEDPRSGEYLDVNDPRRHGVYDPNTGKYLDPSSGKVINAPEQESQGFFDSLQSVAQNVGIMDKPLTLSDQTKMAREAREPIIRDRDMGIFLSRLMGKKSEARGADRALAQQLGVQRNQRKDTQSLRKEYLALPTTKDSQSVTQSFNKIKEAAKKPSAAGDLSLIFNYMKMLDPGSVVRESEFATAQNAAGVPDRVRNLYNRVLSGQRLGVDQRKDFVTSSGRVYDGQMKLQREFEDYYKGLAEAQGLPADQVIFKFKAREQPASLSPEQRRARLRKALKQMRGK